MPGSGGAPCGPASAGKALRRWHGFPGRRRRGGPGRLPASRQVGAGEAIPSREVRPGHKVGGRAGNRDRSAAHAPPGRRSPQGFQQPGSCPRARGLCWPGAAGWLRRCNLRPRAGPRGWARSDSERGDVGERTAPVASLSGTPKVEEVAGR